MKKPRLKPLNEQVMVITGASSGIGLSTARLAARAGAKVVLCSRNEEALRKAVDGIRAEGGEAIWVTADVADTPAVQRVADEAIRAFGRIDTWVNNAGVSIFGKLTEVHMAEKKRLFDVNFWGVVNGCRAAILSMRESGGTIINLGSVASDWSIPLQGIYSAAKHAVKGYTDALRVELEHEEIPIVVTLIKPTAINTPFFENARNHMGVDAQLPGPVYSPQTVARTILTCAVKPMREVNVGGGGRLMSWLEAHAPRLGDLYNDKVLYDQQRGDGPVDPAQLEGNLFAPADDGREDGRKYRGHVMKTSAYTSFVTHPLVGATLTAGLGVLIWRGLDAFHGAFDEPAKRRGAPRTAGTAPANP